VHQCGKRSDQSSVSIGGIPGCGWGLVELNIHNFFPPPVEISDQKEEKQNNQ
jgi:hypothetical protein